MRTGDNIALQIGALLAFVLMRLTAEGWVPPTSVLAVVLLAPALLPTILAIGLAGRERLGRTTALPSALTAVCLVVAGAATPGFSDGRQIMVPLFAWLGMEPPYVGEPVVYWAFGIGYGAVLGFLAALLWSLVAAALTRQNNRRSVGATPRSAS